ncbi:(2Fe-2S)-binding protein [Streptomyces zagrosensis]|uniref:Aerobic-type carbon monoxide dehydrogenase small subunit (CoxS/CutS family) n=1 Tax=Streptomyces zagrosensis TaxID=1042984 RepID=A0A7W9UZW1_9ACTN|nr:(2Fe-2S)-binding protein [Streptomyces zagrosensis]MBB5936164.1 aerobic-type carbon monoxide dehydrogenase small subunit (CoxS/CutS family) [Streptomyces zagrosensis]
MTARLIPAACDATGRREQPLRITVNGEPLDGIAGQSIAGVLLAAGRPSWRTGPSGAQRGLFCGIGACFDCLVTINGDRDVRACLRRAHDGDTVHTQRRDGAHHSGDQDASTVPRDSDSPDGSVL